jgi:hypothetical protein
VYRVLKPGGYHIFTVPYYFDRPTLIRVDTTQAEDIFLLPPEYHGDSVGGRTLAYRMYGIDLLETLREIGFTTEIRLSDLSDMKFGIVNSFVFVSQKKS